MTEEYYTSQGHPCSLDALCRADPVWAASHIRKLTEKLANPTRTGVCETCSEKATVQLDKVLGDVRTAIAMASIVDMAIRTTHKLDELNARITGLLSGCETCTEKAELERRVIGLLDEDQKSQDENRQAAQILIDEIGATGPESIVETATRAADCIIRLRQVKSRKREIDDNIRTAKNILHDRAGVPMACIIDMAISATSQIAELKVAAERSTK